MTPNRNKRQTGRSGGQTKEAHSGTQCLKRSRATGPGRPRRDSPSGVRKEYGEHRFQESFRGTGGSANIQALNNSPSYTVQDSFHLFQLHRGTSIEFILIILVVALIGLAVKLGLRKWKMASIGHQYIHEANEWGRIFESDSDREWQDNHLFSATDNPSSSPIPMGRSAGPGPLPYGTTKAVENAILRA